MAQLDRIVNVQVSLRTTAITERSFSDLLIVGTHTLAAGRVLVITEADELLDLGLPSTSALYKAASAVFKQIPSINRIYIGKRQLNTVTINVTSAATSTYQINILYRNETTGAVQTGLASYIGEALDGTEDIATGLVSAINALNIGVTASATGSSIEIDNDVAGADLGVTVEGNLAIVYQESTEAIADTLAAIKRENHDWYGIALTSHEESDVLAAAEWAETNESMFFTSSNQASILDSAVMTDIGSKLKAKQYFRTATWYHLAEDEYIEAAVPGHCFTFYPGGETWANKRLAGITSDALAEGQSITCNTKNVNTFEPFRNFAITQYGKVAAGEWIDVIRFRDWLVEQIKINVVSAIINADGKVPYTDEGIQIIVNAMRVPLELGIDRGGIAPEELDETGRVIPSYTISAPLAANIPANDKANRVLRDVKFTARLAGAIHATEIKGSLSYNLS